VVDNCDVLIALWDGEAPQKTGGTADIVEYAKKKKRPVIVISTKAPHEISIIKGRSLNIQPL